MAYLNASRHRRTQKSSKTALFSLFWLFSMCLRPWARQELSNAIVGIEFDEILNFLKIHQKNGFSCFWESLEVLGVRKVRFSWLLHTLEVLGVRKVRFSWRLHTLKNLYKFQFFWQKEIRGVTVTGGFSWKILKKSWEMLERSWKITKQSREIVKKSWKIVKKSWKIIKKSWKIVKKS